MRILMSHLEPRAGPKIGGQILGGFWGTKMAITFLKNKDIETN